MKRIFFATFMTLLLAGSLLAQTTPSGPPRGGRGQRRDPTTGLKNALGLTDAQVTAITAIVQGAKSQLQTIEADIKQKHQALNSLLGAASPTAVDVGNAAIALHASENNLKAERAVIINQIKQQLTGEQQQKLDAILTMRGGQGLPFLGLGGPGPRGRGSRQQ
jgi:Spy/CpxP family protein refolding chaperone